MLATILAHRFDAMLAAIRPRGSPFSDALEAIGLAAAAITRMLGPARSSWHVVAALTGALMLSPQPLPVPWEPSSGRLKTGTARGRTPRGAPGQKLVFTLLVVAVFIQRVGEHQGSKEASVQTTSSFRHQGRRMRARPQRWRSRRIVMRVIRGQGRGCPVPSRAALMR